MINDSIAEQTKSTVFGCTIKSNVRIRSNPNTKSLIVKKLTKFSPFVIIENSKNWTKVKGNNFQGWVFSQLISKNIKCIRLKNNVTPNCLGKKKVYRKLSRNEGFKVLKQEIGCNYVLDKKNKKIWIDAINIWPKIYSKTISL